MENAWVITPEMLTAVSTNFNNAIAVSAPVGISVMGLILGVKFVPKLIRALTRG